MDAISNAATEFGAPAESRFFGPRGSRPFQSLQNRYQVETARMASLAEAMKLQADSLGLERERFALEQDQKDAAFVNGQRQQGLDDRDAAFAILESFGDREPDDPSIVQDLHRVVFKNPRLMAVEEFRTAFDSITSLHRTQGREDSDFTTVKMRGQQTFLNNLYEENQKKLADLENPDNWTFNQTTRKNEASEETKKEIEKLKQTQDHIRGLQRKVTTQPLSESEMDAPASGKATTPASTFSKGASLFQ